MAQWLWQLKWALVIAIVAGPVWAYFQYQEGQRLQRIMTQGAEFVAQVDGVQVERHRRSGTTYKLELSWQTESGAHSATLPISGQFAERIIVNDAVNLDQTTLKYLASEEPNGLIVAADGQQEIDNARFGFWFGIIAGIAGLIISPIAFWLEIKQKKAREEDVDATLARMRAGQQP